MTLKVAVGKKYRDLQGREVLILTDRVTEDKQAVAITYRFIGNVGKSYSMTGECQRRHKQFNLVCEI